jgi:hypothetical protein
MEQRYEEDLVSLASVDVMLCFHSRSGGLFSVAYSCQRQRLFPQMELRVSLIQSNLRFSPEAGAQCEAKDGFKYIQN